MHDFPMKCYDNIFGSVMSARVVSTIFIIKQNVKLTFGQHVIHLPGPCMRFLFKINLALVLFLNAKLLFDFQKCTYLTEAKLFGSILDSAARISTTFYLRVHAKRFSSLLVTA